MAANEPPQEVVIREALADLDRLARHEYGASLESLLLTDGPESQLRVQRLVGITVKRKFARPIPAPTYSATHAQYSWPWADMSDSLVPIESDAEQEIELLEKLRQPGAWNELKQFSTTPGDGLPVSWGQFKSDVDTERGMFKIIVLYAADKFDKRETRTFRAYLDAPESRRFEAGLDLATILFDAGVVTPLAGVLGIPTLAVGVALVGVQYGHRMFTDPSAGRAGDTYS